MPIVPTYRCLKLLHIQLGMAALIPVEFTYVFMPELYSSVQLYLPFKSP